MMRAPRSRRMVALFCLLAAIALAGPLACGKRGDPKPPAGKPDAHPRTYPAG